MFYFKIKTSDKNYNYYSIDYEHYKLYSQTTYSRYLFLDINDFISDKPFILKKEYSVKVDFYTDNIFDYTQNKHYYYSDYLKYIVLCFIRDKKISKLLE